MHLLLCSPHWFHAFIITSTIITFLVIFIFCRRDVFFIFMGILNGLDELMNLLFSFCNGLDRGISRSYKCLFWRNSRSSCFDMEAVRATFNGFSIVKCNHVITMPNSIHNISKKLFMHASFLIRVRVGYQLTKGARDTTISKQPLPRSMIGSSRYHFSKMICQAAGRTKL
jgi:hypothetical protein